MKNKALFLDRDGVINESPGEGKYILSRAEFRLREQVVPLIRFARAAGYLIVVVTNQRGVSLEKMTQADLDDIHAYMRELLAAEDAPIDAVYYCPHGLDDGCACRKPKAGMLLRAAEDLDIDLSESIMVGDKESDRAAGTAAGCKATILWK